MSTITTNAYELTFIMGEAATAEQAAAKTKELTALITQAGGTVEKEEAWGKRELAYVIQKNRSGFYTTLWFSLPPTALQAFERALRFDEQIIRSLVTKAYITAQPGSLYPVAAEDEKAPRAKRGSAPEAVSAEEELRQGTTPAKKRSSKAVEDLEADALSDEDRQKQIDAAVDVLLKDEEPSK
jgi:small subunit ribosomal protein S6